MTRELLFTTVFLTLLLLAGAELFGQVDARNVEMSEGVNEAIVLSLRGADEDEVEDLWRDWLKNTYRIKSKRRGGEYQSLDVDLPGLGRVDLYSNVVEYGDDAELNVWIATPDGYLSPESDQARYDRAEKMLMRFAEVVDRDRMQKDVETQEELLEKLMDDLEDLRRDKKKAEDDIVDAREKIAELETEIERNLGEQRGKETAIDEQRALVEEAKRRAREY